LVGELGKLRLLTNLDRAALAAYWGAYALWSEATEAIQKYGTMVKSPSGYPIHSPYVAIANRQAELMMRIASEFGFTPANRGRISTPAPPQPSLFDLRVANSDDEWNRQVTTMLTPNGQGISAVPRVLGAVGSGAAVFFLAIFIALHWLWIQA
jgi:P27 family predicted phage terminase small subunit